MVRCLFAEAFGTFCVIFFGCGSILLSNTQGVLLSPIAIPVAFGLIVTIMIYTFGHVSGAHFNPAVTLAFAITKHFPANRILPYWAAQCIGGIAASLLHAILFPSTGHFGATHWQYISIAQAFGWETVLSFVLMTVIMSVATDTRAVGTMAGVAIGGTVMLDALIGGPFTGASMNPARSIGPALIDGDLTGLWLYCTAPILGAVTAALLYKWVRTESLSLNTDSQ